ncbi:MAG: hypothetical protein DRJ10_13800, partial [Bacteroidetes bacterium]
MIKIYLPTVLVLITLMISVQLFSQTKISYHERFYDKRMKWSEISNEEKGYLTILTDSREYFLESVNEKMIIGEYGLKLDAKQDFSYSINYLGDENALIGISGDNVKISFEIDIWEKKYRVNYTKKGKYKLGNWKKLEAKTLSPDIEKFSLKILFKNNTYHFYYNNFHITDLIAGKIDKLKYFNKLQIGTSMVLDVSDVFIDGYVFLNEYQGFLDGEGLSQKELEKQGF